MQRRTERPAVYQQHGTRSQTKGPEGQIGGEDGVAVVYLLHTRRSHGNERIERKGRPVDDE
jgi:hypothetical protein